MFGRRFHLFSIYGFPVRLDLSWFFLALLITWTLANGYFPVAVPGLRVTTYWLMGAFAALGLFASIVVHEFCHSIVARHYHVPMSGITLFIFGGVAEMNDEPPSPRAEFFVAIAGPIASIWIAYLSFLVAGWTQVVPGSAQVLFGIFSYLAAINFILVVFNLIPAFPLDGGRILRAFLWKVLGSLQRATRITSLLGSGFGFLLMVLGIFDFLSGNLIAGLWEFFIGLFLSNAADLSYKQLMIRRELEGQPVVNFMRPNPVTVEPGLSTRDLIENCFYKYFHRTYPVTEDGKLIGCVSIENIKDIPREEWGSHTVREIMTGCSDYNTIGVHADTMQALSKMNAAVAERNGSKADRQSVPQLLVVDHGKLQGIVSLRDILNFLSFKAELEHTP